LAKSSYGQSLLLEKHEKVEKKKLISMQCFKKYFQKKEGKDAHKQRQVFLVVKNSQKAMIKIWY
jgi:hypothetical protein